MKCLPILLSFGALSSCVSIPEHTICQLDVSRSGAECAKTSSPSTTYFAPLRDLDGYILRSPQDERKLVEYVKRNCQGPKK